MQKRVKPRTKCKIKITMEMGATGKLKFSAVKGPNNIVGREETLLFLDEVNEWLIELAAGWESIYNKSEEG